MVAGAFEPGYGRIPVLRQAVAIAQAQRRFIHDAWIAAFDFFDPGDLRDYLLCKLAVAKHRGDHGRAPVCSQYDEIEDGAINPHLRGFLFGRNGRVAGGLSRRVGNGQGRRKEDRARQGHRCDTKGF